MSNAKRSLAAATALVCASTSYAQESPFSQMVTFDDNLTDVGNTGIATSGDNKQAAISIMYQQPALGPATLSCADPNLCLPEANPSLSEEQLLDCGEPSHRRLAVEHYRHPGLFGLSVPKRYGPRR
ncbi:hypothetical protein [Microbulbifer discodermiae]|uniref:hypothetical protein n=1 Tax=Microbulbifer sp. 2201CG32-9 TaxID=3232309 RepID=UPI00345C3B0C